MRVSAARLAEWRREVGMAASDARLAALSELEAWASARPSATVEEHRAAAIRIVCKASTAHGRIASATSGRLFDELAREQGSAARFRVMDTTDRAYTEEEVRKLANLLRDDRGGEFRARCAAIAESQAWRNSGASMAANCERARVRWARVPSGGKTCGWCLMLASRGFAYKSAGTAGAGRHKGCQCAVVPDFDGRTTVEGYDPDALYSRWKACADTVRVDPGTTSEERLKLILAECDRRDPLWLGAGKAPKVTYLKPEKALEDHERAGIRHLSESGFKIDALKEDPKAPANMDVRINGELWEMKNVTNSESSVSNQVKRARMKWLKLGKGGKMRAVFTQEGCASSHGSVCEAVEKRLRPGEEALVVSPDGRICRFGR
ncbi:hypothetical protein [uncultured Adlercreutzia sp.]|uniref:VG15 protein n=1 Tax=uncultured Adlercreutzia sp. TaxID=875803 RepID=UPI0025EEECB7|nr:hypothetical protein [uncultured Adlercreutzia sp.]